MTPPSTSHQNDARTLLRLQNALGKIQQALPEIPLQQLMLFLAIAGDEGVTLGELCNKLDMAQSTGSRLIIGMTTRTVKKGRGGYDLVRTHEDPNDTRRKLIWLTPRGRSLVAEMTGIIDGKE